MIFHRRKRVPVIRFLTLEILQVISYELSDLNYVLPSGELDVCIPAIIPMLSYRRNLGGNALDFWLSY